MLLALSGAARLGEAAPGAAPGTQPRAVCRGVLPCGAAGTEWEAGLAPHPPCCSSSGCSWWCALVAGE